MIIDEDHPCGYEAVNTVLHECFHAIYRLHNLRKPDDDEEVEERIVDSMANGMVELIRRNPPLVEWIRDKLKEADAP